MIRDNGTIINQFGVEINEDEARRLRNLVQRVNRKRSKMLDQFKDKPLYYGGKRLDESREQLMLMGEEMDIMIRKRSAALNRFRSKAEFNAYIRQTERAAATDYMEYRTRLYKRNYTKALTEQYGMYPDLLKGVLMKIRMMKPESFAQLVGMDRLFQIKEHYSLGGALDRLKAVRERLGLSNPDYDDEQEEDYY